MGSSISKKSFLKLFFSIAAVFSIYFAVTANTEEQVSTEDNSTPKRYIDFKEQPIDYHSLNIGEGFVYENKGIASYYADQFHNLTTANGEIFDMNEYTAAHKTLPFGTIVRVTNVRNNKSTLVRVNDRGPYIENRILDLSYKAAKAIGGISVGTPKIKMEAFVPDKNFSPKENEEFYFAYSLEEKPMCLPKTVFTVVDSTNLFHKAVENLKETIDLYPDEKFFLVLNTSKDNKYEHSKSDFVYYIAKVRTRLELNDSIVLNLN